MGENIRVEVEGPITGLAALFLEKCWYCSHQQVPTDEEHIGLCDTCKDILRRYQ